MRARARVAANTFSSSPLPHHIFRHDRTEQRIHRNTQRRPRVCFRPFLLAPFLPSILLPPLFYSLPISKSQIINNQKRSGSSPPSTQQIARSSVHSTRNYCSIAPASLSRSPPGTNALKPLWLAIAALIRVLTPCGSRINGDRGMDFSLDRPSRCRLRAVV